MQFLKNNEGAFKRQSFWVYENLIFPYMQCKKPVTTTASTPSNIKSIRQAVRFPNTFGNWKKQTSTTIFYQVVNSKACECLNGGSKNCNLCLAEKICLVNEDNRLLLNKRTELISKCWHENKFLYKTTPSVFLFKHYIASNL